MNERFGDTADFPFIAPQGTFQRDAEYFIATDEAGHLAGIARVSKKQDTLLLNTVEISARERHHGAAKALLHALVEDAQASKQTIWIDGLTNDGKSFLMREIARTNVQHPGAIQFVQTC